MGKVNNPIFSPKIYSMMEQLRAEVDALQRRYHQDRLNEIQDDLNRITEGLLKMYMQRGMTYADAHARVARDLATQMAAAFQWKRPRARVDPPDTEPIARATNGPFAASMGEIRMAFLRMAHVIGGASISGASISVDDLNKAFIDHIASLPWHRRQLLRLLSGLQAGFEWAASKLARERRLG